MRPKVRCFMAASPTGYIARLDGQEDWLSAANWHSFSANAEQFNNFVIGRETYEMVSKNTDQDYNLYNVPASHKLVVSSNPNFEVIEGFKVVHNPGEAITFLTTQGVEKILLAGGGQLNAAFAKAHLIDEFELIIEPYVIAKGRPVFALGDYEFPLKLAETEKLSEDRVRILYEVKK